MDNIDYTNYLVFAWLVGTVSVGAYYYIGIINKQGYLDSLDTIVIPLISSFWFIYLPYIFIKNILKVLKEIFINN